jgi:hypothetical protein
MAKLTCKRTQQRRKQIKQVVLLKAEEFTTDNKNIMLQSNKHYISIKQQDIESSKTEQTNKQRV